MGRHISRRQLLRMLSMAVGKVGLDTLTGCASSVGRAEDGLDPQAYLPLVGREPAPVDTPTPVDTATATPAPTLTPTFNPVPTLTDTPDPPPSTPCVVHVHAADAASWDFASGWYGDYVNQDVVNDMVDEGIRQLTGQTSVEAAWEVLLPAYAPGQGIAIKVNFNNASCTDGDNTIDALVEPINALVRGLKTRGVQEEDIWVYDALRPMPVRFRSRILYPSVRFFDSGACAEQAGFDNTDPDAEMRFGHASLTSRRITDLLVAATYLINVPIIKDHGISGVTLGFKNHFGSIDRIMRAGNDNLHYYISPGDDHYDSGYSPLMELNSNPHIWNKTVLTLGDGLYGALGNTNVPPSRWASFGNEAANSLFFSLDPVAVDCVMLDLLDADPAYHPRLPGTDDYLRLAAGAHMGVYERGDPWGSGYTQIFYAKVEL